jgi:hypothetical protein
MTASSETDHVGSDVVMLTINVEFVPRESMEPTGLAEPSNMHVGAHSIYLYSLCPSR